MAKVYTLMKKIQKYPHPHRLGEGVAIYKGRWEWGIVHTTLFRETVWTNPVRGVLFSHKVFK